jgi:hypothetical protein
MYLNDIAIDADLDNAMQIAAKYGHFEMFVWLFDIGCRPEELDFETIV